MSKLLAFCSTFLSHFLSHLTCWFSASCLLYLYIYIYILYKKKIATRKKKFVRSWQKKCSD